MRLAFAINGAEYELGVARNYFSLTLGERLDLILHKPVPGDIGPYAREDHTHVLDASCPTRARLCHDRYIWFRDWELVVSRTRPVSGSTPKNAFSEDAASNLAERD